MTDPFDEQDTDPSLLEDTTEPNEPYEPLALTIDGPRGAGKTHLAALVGDLLSQHGYHVEHVDDVDGVAAVRSLLGSTTVLRPGIRVRIHSENT